MIKKFAHVKTSNQADKSHQNNVLKNSTIREKKMKVRAKFRNGMKRMCSPLKM